MLSLCAIGVIALVLNPISAKAELHTGTFQLFPGGGWNFSDPDAYSIADFVFDVTTVSKTGETIDGGDILTAITPALIYYAGNAEDTYDNLAVAPTDLSLYKVYEFATVNEVFVIYTREGHYAKISVTNLGSLMSFEYTYQDDGSEVLSITTPVEETTWGRVKALYR
jgi:hypothetical protein